jgi:hypothetical protein
VQGWNDTIGPVVALGDNAADALTGGLLSQFGVVVEELKVALKTIAEEELLTFTDIFSRFNTCVQKGFAEDLFLWSDMSHYRRPSALCQAFVDQVDKLAQKGMTQESEQFLAFTLGYITHLGTDTIAHAFVNEQCGGSFRNHPQRHHLIENHIDAWNYAQTAPGGKNAPIPGAIRPTIRKCRCRRSGTRYKSRPTIRTAISRAPSARPGFRTIRSPARRRSMLTATCPNGWPRRSLTP